MLGLILLALWAGCIAGLAFAVRGIRPIRHAPRFPVVLRRIPFTYAVLVLMIGAGVASGALWTSGVDQPWWPSISYGLPAFAEGRWWTVVTGSLLTQEPGHYVPLLGGMALFLSWTEWHFGTARTAALCVLGQLGAVFGSAALLELLGPTGWTWAVERAGDLDAGFSAGLLACMAVVGSALPAPWRMRFRLALLAYITLSFLYIGGIADLEHLVAGATGLVLTRDRVRTAATVRQWRELALAVLTVIAARPLLTWDQVDSPLGSVVFADGNRAHAIAAAAAIAVVGIGLWRGLRTAWWAGAAIGAWYVVGGVVTTVHLVVDQERPETLGLSLGGALLWLVALMVLWRGRGAFQAPWRAKHLRGDGGTSTVLADLRTYGGGSLSWMTTWAANSHLPLRRGADAQVAAAATDGGYVAYQVYAGVALALADPVCPPGATATAVGAFTHAAEDVGLVPCLFAVSADTADAARAEGWRVLEIAQDTIVDLPGLEFRGKRWQDVRTALNHAGRAEISFTLTHWGELDRRVRAQLWQISQEWVGDKGLPEMGFTLGTLTQAQDPHVLLGVATGADGTVHGFTSWLPVYGPGGQVRGWTLDLMRHADTGFRPVMEFLIASACLTLRERGAAYLSLSGAPLATSGQDPSALGRLLTMLSHRLEPLYGFQSLEAFKAKFSPRTAPLYLVYRDEGDLARIALGVARAYLPTATGRDLAAALRPEPRPA
ncbi:MAG: bifunctional lysylphosphatidylglycerol flippase/synthetase MprF [Cellulomonadaceae bacterium]